MDEQTNGGDKVPEHYRVFPAVSVDVKYGDISTDHEPEQTERGRQRVEPFVAADEIELRHSCLPRLTGVEQHVLFLVERTVEAEVVLACAPVGNFLLRFSKTFFKNGKISAMVT